MSNPATLRTFAAAMAAAALFVLFAPDAARAASPCALYPTSAAPKDGNLLDTDAPEIGDFARSLCRLMQPKPSDPDADGSPLKLEGVYFAGRRLGVCVQTRFILGRARPTAMTRWEMLRDTPEQNYHPDADDEVSSPCGSKREGDGQPPIFERELRSPAARRLIAAKARDVLDEVYGGGVSRRLEVLLVFRRTEGAHPDDGWTWAIGRLAFAGNDVKIEVFAAAPEIDDEPLPEEYYRGKGNLVPARFDTLGTSGSQYLRYEILTPRRDSDAREVKLWVLKLTGAGPKVVTMEQRCDNQTARAARNHFRWDANGWHHNSETGRRANICRCRPNQDENGVFEPQCPNVRFTP